MNPRLRAALYELRYWLFPGGLLVGAALAWLRLDPESPLLVEVVHGYPWAVYGAGLLLAWRFRRSRVAAALLVVAVFLGGLPRLPDPAGSAAVVVSGVLLPVFLAGLALLRDRPILSRKGLAPILVAVGFLGVLALALRGSPDELRSWASWAVPVRRTPWELPLPLLSPAVGGVVLLIATLVRRGAVERAFLWALVAAHLALRAGPGTTAGGLHLTVAGLILTVAVVESSFAMAFHDELTGLPGRRALLQELDRLGGVYTLAMVDVDHFKRFNDRHGHEVGDQVLKMVAGCLRRAPGGGRAFRYGGEEFTVVYRGTSLGQAEEHLEGIRAAVEDATFTVRGPARILRGRKARGRRTPAGTELSVTVSVGAAEPRASDDGPEDVLERADRALYRAKKKGRNRVAS